MGHKSWDAVSIPSHGLLSTASISTLNICEAEITTVSATAVLLTITKVGSGVTKMKIGYRERKESDADALSFTATKNNPAVGQTFNITGLDSNKFYEFFPYSEDDMGDYDDPGPILLAYTSSIGWREATCNTIRSRFGIYVEDVVSGLLVQYDNEDTEDILDNTRWVRLAIKLGNSRQVSMGVNPRHRADGIMIASVFVPFSMGDQAAMQIADIIETAFRGAKANGVVFRTPTTETIGRISDSWQVNVSCPFYVDFIA